MATMKIAVANVPTAMYALCNPTVVPFEITALKLDSPKGRAWVVSASVSDTISFVFTTASRMNSSTIERKGERERKRIFAFSPIPSLTRMNHSMIQTANETKIILSTFTSYSGGEKDEVKHKRISERIHVRW